MKKGHYIQKACITLLTITLFCLITTAQSAVSTSQKQSNMTPVAVLERLKEGNQRY